MYLATGNGNLTIIAQLLSFLGMSIATNRKQLPRDVQRALFDKAPLVSTVLFWGMKYCLDRNAYDMDRKNVNAEIV